MIALKLNEPVKVSIMGMIYNILLKTDDDIAKDLGAGVGEKCGYCDPYERVIAVAQNDTLKESIQHVEKIREGTLRHEIIHAFMYESGLWNDSFVYDGQWATNEEMIDWFAIQSPKIFEVFWKLGIVTIQSYRLRDPKDSFEKVCNTDPNLKDGFDKASKCLMTVCDSMLENQINEAKNKIASARIMAEANRIQTESIGKNYEAQRGHFCPPPKMDGCPH